MKSRKTRKPFIIEVDNIIGLGRMQNQTEMLKRVFAGMDMMDATADMVLVVKPEDYIGAIPHSLTDCELAKCGCRMYDSRAMVFLKTRAYVDFVCEDGKRRCLRYMLSEKTIAAQHTYDKTNGAIHIPPGTYMLKAPVGYDRLDAQREHSIEQRKKPEVRKKKNASQRKRAAAIKAKAKKVKTKADAKPRPGVVGIVRDGSGLIQTQVISE